MRVFKFGGASVKDAVGVRRVAEIIKRFKGEKLAIVVSAMGKVTNALEEVIQAHAKQTGQASTLFEAVKQQHFTLMHELFDAETDPVFAAVHDTFVEAEWVLDDAPDANYDYMYDQIICMGELVSSHILAAFLKKNDLSVAWQDARAMIITDDTWREGWVQWDKTKPTIQEKVGKLLEENDMVVTQGFIGSTNENATTTLGREGSDYSAAIIAHCMDAESMTIWKDVPGVMTADPRLFENVVKLDRLSYKEAIEMTYYGASVIHPKTIKPLQNKSIPMYVKSFLDVDAPGTEIASDVEDAYPPIVVVENNQALLHISTRDYSFVAEHHLAQLFKVLADHRIFVNSMQNTAISFTICVPNQQERIEKFTKSIETEFKVTSETGLELVTVRHYNDPTLQSLKAGKVVLFEERIRNTVQMVVRDVPVMVRKS